MYEIANYQINTKSSSMHELPPMQGLEEGFIVRSLTLHYKKLFPRLEPVTTMSHDNIFTIASKLPLIYLTNIID